MPIDIVNFLIYNFQIFLLSFARGIALLTILPLFGGVNVPNRVRVVLSLFLAYMAFPIISQMGYKIPENLASYFFMVLMEVIIGLSIGFFVYLIILGFQLAAQIFSTSFGLAFVETVDPLSEASVPTYSTLFLIIATIVFIYVDGPALTFQAFIESYKKIWVYNITLDSLKYIAQFAVSGFIGMLEIGLKISLPIIAVIFAIDIIVGIIGKTAPQMNILNMSFDLKMVVGIIVVLIFIAPILTYMQDAISTSFYKIWNYIRNFPKTSI